MTIRSRKIVPITLACLAVVLAGGTGAADELANKLANKAKPPPSGGTVPVKAPSAGAGLHDLQLVDPIELVMSAAKQPTTVAEAPLILHVKSAAEIRQQGHDLIFEAIGRMPGFMPTQAYYHLGPSALPLGVWGGMLVVYDGVSMHDPISMYTPLNRSLPVELIRRVEATTGPGGVLWGADSFVGVVALMPKTADDLDGVEAYVGAGTGPGRADDYRFWVMAGQKLWKDRIKVLVHASYERWRDAERSGLNNIVVTSMPWPQGPEYFGPYQTVVAAPSQLLQINGNAQLGPFTLGWRMPIWGKFNHNLSPHSSFVHETLGEDSLGCTTPGGSCIDPGRRGRENTAVLYDQLAYLGYGTPLINQRLRINAKTSFRHIVRTTPHYTGVTPSSLIPGGFTYDMGARGYETGTTLDGSVFLTSWARLLAGGEFSYVLFPESRTRFLTYDSTVVTLPVQCDPPTATEVCPLPFNNRASRASGGGYVSGRVRLGNLTVDGGFRLQGAGGTRGYGLTQLFSGAAAYRLFGEVFLKANYAEGFRPPTLFQTDIDPRAVYWIANSNLGVERSRAGSGQLLAYVLRDYGALKVMRLSADYSYTFMSNYIRMFNSVWTNAGDIGINAASLTARVDMKGGHWLSTVFNFQHLVDSQRGVIRPLPTFWFSAEAYFRLLGDRLALSSNLMIVGSMEDMNKYPTQEAAPVFLGRTEVQGGKLVAVPDKVSIARGADNFFDRLPPAAVWNIGLESIWLQKKLKIRADVYNVLDARYFYPEPQYDMAARLEFMPNQAPGFSFFISASYQLHL